jgi:KIF-1 binding protein C terminal
MEGLGLPDSMYLVGESDEQINREFAETLASADALVDVIDDEKTPYASKYKARDLLDVLIRKLEATQTVAMLDPARKSTVQEMGNKLACARVRVGTISWECDEPHNAQSELELALSHYGNNYAQLIADIAGPEDDSDAGEEDSGKTKKQLTADDDDTTSASTLQPPELKVSIPSNLPDTMKCLNMLGILWAGRGQLKKSFLYFKAAKNIYDENRHDTLPLLPLTRQKDLEDQYTHNLFYLAQAYGHIGDPAKSCEYCHETLQRQLTGGFATSTEALEWAKNCSFIADFYVAREEYSKCASALACAQIVLKQHVLPTCAGSSSSSISSSSGEGSGGASSSSSSESSGSSQVVQNAVEVNASIERRWAKLEIHILGKAYERRVSSNEEGSTVGASAESAVVVGGLFVGLPVPPAAIATRSPNDIQSFEDARALFISATIHIEAAKRHYVLDGKLAQENQWAPSSCMSGYVCNRR